MSKLQEFCELLDDRGVEPTIAHTFAGHGSGHVKWQANGTEFMAFEHDGALRVCQLGSVTLSPEEAIHATLGPGTCKRVFHSRRSHASGPQFTCSQCGYGASDDRWSFCPKCGARYANTTSEARMEA